MTEQKKLREFTNSVRIVGTLKEMNLQVGVNKTDKTTKQIMGNIVVLVEDGGHLNEHTVNLFAKETSKLFKGYQTIMNEYKSIDTHGREGATRVSVSGSIDGNDYVGQDGQLRELNRIRGLFVNRLEGADAEKQDEALAQIELVVSSLTPETDREGIETGAYKINGFTVGYNNSVVVLRNMVVGEDLADVITENYEPMSTGKLTFKINNYVEVVQREADTFDDANGGFGVQVDLGNEARNFTRNLQVIGGFPPYLDERALDEDDIRLAQQIRALHIQQVKNSVPATPPGGFGQAGLPPQQPPKAKPNFKEDPFADDSNTIDISDDDLPF